MQASPALVTGANSGIGRALSVGLARRGTPVLMVCRNPESGAEAKREIESAAPGTPVELELADLSSMDEVRRLAETIRHRHDSLGVLVNNAGLYLPNRHVTADGLETMFAVNHLAPFLLTRLLEAPLARDGGARVVTVSSEGHRVGRLDFDDLQCERRFAGLRQYGNTKLANILFTRELARRWADHGVVATCFHPGAVASGFAQDEPGLFGFLVQLGRPLLRSPERGADTGVHLAADPEGTRAPGGYFIDRKPRKPSRQARDDGVAQRLWEASEGLAGLS